MPQKDMGGGKLGTKKHNTGARVLPWIPSCVTTRRSPTLSTHTFQSGHLPSRNNRACLLPSFLHTQGNFPWSTSVNPPPSAVSFLQALQSPQMSLEPRLSFLNFSSTMCPQWNVTCGLRGLRNGREHNPQPTGLPPSGAELTGLDTDHCRPVASMRKVKTKTQREGPAPADAQHPSKEGKCLTQTVECGTETFLQRGRGRRQGTCKGRADIPWTALAGRQEPEVPSTLQRVVTQLVSASLSIYQLFHFTATTLDLIFHPFHFFSINLVLCPSTYLCFLTGSWLVSTETRLSEQVRKKF